MGAERAQSADLEQELSATRKGLTELNTRVGTLAEAAAQAAQELAAAEAEGQIQHEGVYQLEQELQVAVRRLAELQNQVQADHAAHLEQMRAAGSLHNEAVSCKAQV